MHELEPADFHCLQAALGWLGLGNPREAREELGKLRTEMRKHPDVLEVDWTICAAERRWDEALKVAQSLVACAPDRSSGWLHEAYALRRAPGGGLAQAWEVLLPAADKFPKEPVIMYNLACYACQMSRLDDARKWLHRAVSVGSLKQIKQMALDDSDLQPMWDEIRKMESIA